MPERQIENEADAHEPYRIVEGRELDEEVHLLGHQRDPQVVDQEEPGKEDCVEHD